jgi:hypothetical protein
MSRDDLYLQSDSLLDDLVSERLMEYPILHAGAVADRRQRAAVICGCSGSGKTSLVTAALLRGNAWLSDELLCFRQADPLIAEGFRRNFNLKERSFAEFPNTAGLTGSREFLLRDRGQRIRFFDADLLPGGKFAAAGNVRAIILPRYCEDSGVLARPITGPELVQRLAPELRTSHIRSISWLAEVTRKVPAFTLRYNRPDDAADSLNNLLEEL